LELFFDLVFVVAIAVLAVFLHDHLTLGGFLGFALLLVPVDWAWMSFAYYADQFDTDDTLFRVVMLVAMLASAALAVNVAGTLEGSSAGFVVANVVLQALLIGLYAWAWRNATEARPMSARYATGFSVGALIWPPSSRRNRCATTCGRLHCSWRWAHRSSDTRRFARCRATSRTCPNASACSP
jgi:low temperature requirement protein LtrA